MEVMSHVDEPALQALTSEFLARHPEEAARILEVAPTDQAIRLLSGEPEGRVIAVLSRLTPDAAGRLVEQLDDGTASRLLPLFEPGRVSSLLARVDPPVRARLLGLLDPRAAQEIAALMEYPGDCAGHLMDPRVLTFRPDATVEQALARLRAEPDRRLLDACLVNTDGGLVGVVALQDLALATPGTELGTLVRAAPVTVHAMSTREDVVELLTQRRVTTLPVVDVDGRLLGVIRHDRMLVATQEEASADLQTMVGVSKEERALSPVFFAVRRRLPWLQINLVTAFLAAAVVGLFEDTIARFTALAILLPVVAGQSGNTGAQALAVTMRGLVLREVRIRHWRQVVVKEGLVGLVNGVGVSLTTSLAVLVWSRSPGLALIIGISMVVSMIVAGAAGAAVPMVLEAARQDPAQSSSIVLTTVTDVVGFFSFLGIATLLAGLM